MSENGLHRVPAMKNALEQIQETHDEITIYEWDHDSNVFKLDADGERIVIARLCRECTAKTIIDDIEDASYDASGNYDDAPFPCETRKLADAGLAGGERG
ncbi:hypothetical protein [Glutamicibacter arilaitensis]|uniref:hypothetical protein n=1 Tax=Glutamicibacter arilaitensis TaxID=256701 RepID=UPI00384D5B5E